MQSSKKYIIQQSGRSMLELLGVMALAGIMLIGVAKLYQSVRTRQIRIVAESDISELAKNAQLLFSGVDSYDGISIEYLQKSGALRSDKKPFDATEYFVQSEDSGKAFSINMKGLNFGNCAYIATTKMDWAYEVRVNGDANNAKTSCFKTGDNEVAIIVK